METWQKTTDTSIDQFFAFMKVIFSEHMEDKVAAHLKATGLDNIRISVEHIRSAQTLLKDQLAKPEPRTQQIIMSGHNNGVC
jgi:hypothetical protein